MALPATPLQFVGYAFVLLGVAVLAVSARYVWRATAVLRAEPIDRPGDADAGALVRVRGTAVEGSEEPVAAPFSGTGCLALRYEIQERGLGLVNLLPWFETIASGTAAVPFAVRAASGEVPITEPTRTVALTSRTVATVDADGEPPERIARFERERDGESTTLWRRRPPVLGPLFAALSLGARRYRERRLEPGDGALVVGRVQTSGAGDTVDSLVVSDRSPVRTLVRMAQTSLVGLFAGVAGVAFGLVLVVA